MEESRKNLAKCRECEASEKSAAVRAAAELQRKNGTGNGRKNLYAPGKKQGGK